MDLIKSTMFKSLGQNDNVLRVIATTQEPDKQGDIVITKGYDNDHLMNNTDHKVKFEHIHDVGEITKSISILDAEVPYVEQEFTLAKSDLGKAMTVFVKEDVIERTSIGGKASDIVYKSGYRHIGKVRPHETTLCLMGVNPSTKVLKSASIYADKVQLAKSLLKQDQFEALFTNETEMMTLLIGRELDEIRKSSTGFQEQINQLNETMEFVKKSLDQGVVYTPELTKEFIEEVADKLGLSSIKKSIEHENFISSLKQNLEN